MAVTIEDFLGNFHFNVPKADSKAMEGVATLVDGIFLGLGKLTGAAAGIWGITSALTGFVDEALRIRDVSEVTNTGVDSLYNWSNAMSAAGEDGAAALEDLRRIATDLMGARTGEGSNLANTLESWGVKAFDANNQLRPMTDILTDLSRKVQEWSHDPAMQRKIFDSLGISDSTARFLMRGPEQVAAFQKQISDIYTMTAEHVQTARDVSDEWNTIQAMWGAAGDEAAAGLMPALKDILGWFKELSKWILEDQTHFEYFIAIISGLVIGALLPLFDLISAPLLAAIGAAGALAAAFAGIGAAIKYLMDDYQAWKEGSESTFGAVWQYVEPVMNAFRESFQSVRDYLVLMWNDPKAAFDQFWNNFKAFPAKLREWKNALWEMFSSGKFAEMGRDAGKAIVKAFQDSWAAVKTFFKNAFSGTGEGGGEDGFGKILYDGLIELIPLVATAGAAIGEAIYNAIAEMLSPLWDEIKSKVSGLLDWLWGEESAAEDGKHTKTPGGAATKGQLARLVQVMPWEDALKAASSLDGAQTAGTVLHSNTEYGDTNVTISAPITVGNANGNSLVQLQQAAVSALDVASQKVAGNLQHSMTVDSATSSQ